MSNLSAACVALVTLASCGGGGSHATVDARVDAPPAVDDPDSATIPPRGQDLLLPWLAAGHYKAWPCEAATPHPQTFPSNHGENRSCNNPILHAAPAGFGNYPLDSSSVKELYDDDDVTLIGYSVSRKIDTNLGDGWYWFETKRGKITEGQATSDVNSCVACHQCAPRDFTYAVVK